MQYGHTVLGAVVTTAWLALWWRRTPPRDPVAVDSSIAALALGWLASSAVWLLPLMAGAGVAAIVGSHAGKRARPRITAFLHDDAA